jgi:diguanylate cyclase (GGDEF)-like protein
VLLAPLPVASSDRSVLLAALVVTTMVIAAALFVPWRRLSPWCEAIVPISFFVVVGLVRHAGGGATSGYFPLVVLPILWLAMYGSRAQLWLALATTAATFLLPLLLVGPPRYPALGWRDSVLWVSFGALIGSPIQALVDQSRNRHADVDALGAITRALHTESDPRAELCAAARLVTGAFCAILFEPQAGGTLAPTAGTDGIDLEQIRADPRGEDSAAGHAWRAGKRLYIGDAAKDPRASGRMHEITGVRGALYQPVTRDRRRMGVLVIGFTEPRRRMPTTALYLVELLAAEIGAAIDRADLVALLGTQSRSDPLTGVANRRSWDEEIHRELTRVQRGDPLTLAIIDLDHFKAYNDTHGHLAGDDLLKALVTAIRAELRTGDIIARWGGDEFALALPDCGLKKAHAITSRLLKVVPRGQTASIGLALARHEDTPAALTERADRALYSAKESGRNQVKALS